MVCTVFSLPLNDFSWVEFDVGFIVGENFTLFFGGASTGVAFSLAPIG